MSSYKSPNERNNADISGSSVSVVITCYKQSAFVGTAIESVLAQTYPASEIIVVDDGSPDNTAAVVAQYPAVQYVYQENQDVSAARNNGIKHASGHGNRYGIYCRCSDQQDRAIGRGRGVLGFVEVLDLGGNKGQTSFRGWRL